MIGVFIFFITFGEVWMVPPPKLGVALACLFFPGLRVEPGPCSMLSH